MSAILFSDSRNRLRNGVKVPACLFIEPAFHLKLFGIGLRHKLVELSLRTHLSSGTHLKGIRSLKHELRMDIAPQQSFKSNT
ncbi:MAG TPA: hypothetical protein VEF04_20250, partial [Blastocatellia bacterium]|nr:hypothetical protein [Blastocatellia bacterium]